MRDRGKGGGREGREKAGRGVEGQRVRERKRLGRGVWETEDEKERGWRDRGLARESGGVRGRE